MARSIPSIHKSVKEISEIETDALRARSLGEKFGDFVVSRSGRMGFIVFHAVWLFVSLRHHKRLLDVALPHWAALHIGWPSLNGLKRRHLMGEQVRDRRGYVHRRGEADHSFL